MYTPIRVLAQTSNTDDHHNIVESNNYLNEKMVLNTVWYRLPEPGTGTSTGIPIGFGNGTTNFGRKKSGTSKMVPVRYQNGTVLIPIIIPIFIV